MLTTDQKGAIAEAEITAAAIQLGLGVYRPMYNQKVGVNWADDFELGARLTSLLGP